MIKAQSNSSEKKKYYNIIVIWKVRNINKDIGIFRRGCWWSILPTVVL